MAQRQGAILELLQPALLYNTSDSFSLREAVKTLVSLRSEAEKTYGKKSPQALAAKERANSSYGKLAQGLAVKRAFSTREARVKDIPPSPITSAPQACLVTSLVRAIISAALCQIGQRGRRIISVTTDGFLCNSTLEEVNSLDLFGFKEWFSEARHALANDPAIWELKHGAEMVLSMRTRGAIGVGEVNNLPMPLARAGYKPDDNVKQRMREVGTSETLAEMFFNRVGKNSVQTI